MPFSNGSWNKISVSRKALLSTTAKHSILQNNFQLYSLEYRHLPHQLHQGTVSSAQPALTASGALVPSATPTALQVALKPLSFCPHHGWVLKLLTSLTSRLVQRKLYPEVCNLTKLREPCKAHSSTSASSLEWFQIILPFAQKHTIAINLSITTSTRILEVFCKTKAEMLYLSHYLVSEPLQWRPSPDCTFIMQSNSIFVLIVYSKSSILQRSSRKPQDQKMCQQFINLFSLQRIVLDVSLLFAEGWLELDLVPFFFFFLVSIWILFTKFNFLLCTKKQGPQWTLQLPHPDLTTIFKYIIRDREVKGFTCLIQLPKCEKVPYLLWEVLIMVVPF